jgi:hypothetical protein
MCPAIRPVNSRLLVLCIKVSGALVASLSLSSMALADEFVQQPKHEHGVAILNVALEGADLQVSLDTPAINLLGFEHTPNGAAEREAVAKLNNALQQPTQLFLLPAGAHCMATTVKVSAPAWDKAAQPSASHNASAVSEAHAAHEDHADYEATYAFKCQQPRQLKSIDVALLKLTQPGTKLRANLAVRGSQSYQELHADQSVLRLP